MGLYVMTTAIYIECKEFLANVMLTVFNLICWWYDRNNWEAQILKQLNWNFKQRFTESWQLVEGKLTFELSLWIFMVPSNSVKSTKIIV